MKSSHTYTMTRIIQKLRPVPYYDNERILFVGEVDYTYTVYFTDEHGNTKRRNIPRTKAWNKVIGGSILKHNMKVTHYNPDEDIIIVERR